MDSSENGDVHQLHPPFSQFSQAPQSMHRSRLHSSAGCGGRSLFSRVFILCSSSFILFSSSLMWFCSWCFWCARSSAHVDGWFFSSMFFHTSETIFSNSFWFLIQLASVIIYHPIKLYNSI